MESDLQIIIKGVQEELGKNIGTAVVETVKALKKANENLDIRRMHRILLPTDFAGELAELSGETASGTPITYTNEDYAIAVAKVLILPLHDGETASGTPITYTNEDYAIAIAVAKVLILPLHDEYEIVLVVNANVAVALVPNNKQDHKSRKFPNVVHLLHRELCHVHDNNKQIDAFNGIMLRHRYEGKDIYIRPLSETCWSEYIANILCSSSADESWISTMAESFANAIERTKLKIEKEILKYRYHSDLDKLLDIFQRHGGYLIKTAAYNLGYIDGLNKPLEKLSDKAFESLKGSYFESTWYAMQSALREMRSSYPDGWVDLSIYDNLAGVIEDYYGEMGFYLSSIEDGRAYIDILFRPETTPNL